MNNDNQFQVGEKATESIKNQLKKLDSDLTKLNELGKQIDCMPHEIEGKKRVIQFSLQTKGKRLNKEYNQLINDHQKFSKESPVDDDKLAKLTDKINKAYKEIEQNQLCIDRLDPALLVKLNKYKKGYLDYLKNEKSFLDGVPETLELIPLNQLKILKIALEKWNSFDDLTEIKTPKNKLLELLKSDLKNKLETNNEPPNDIDNIKIDDIDLKHRVAFMIKLGIIDQLKNSIDDTKLIKQVVAQILGVTSSKNIESIRTYIRDYNHRDKKDMFWNSSTSSKMNELQGKFGLQYQDE